MVLCGGNTYGVGAYVLNLDFVRFSNYYTCKNVTYELFSYMSLKDKV